MLNTTNNYNIITITRSKTILYTNLICATASRNSETEVTKTDDGGGSAISNITATINSRRINEQAATRTRTAHGGHYSGTATPPPPVNLSTRRRPSAAEHRSRLASPRHQSDGCSIADGPSLGLIGVTGSTSSLDSFPTATTERQNVKQAALYAAIDALSPAGGHRAPPTPSAPG